MQILAASKSNRFFVDTMTTDDPAQNLILIQPKHDRGLRTLCALAVRMEVEQKSCQKILETSLLDQSMTDYDKKTAQYSLILEVLPHFLNSDQTYSFSEIFTKLNSF